jgi:hypothetical protein
MYILHINASNYEHLNNTVYSSYEKAVDEIMAMFYEMDNLGIDYNENDYLIKMVN